MATMVAKGSAPFSSKPIQEKGSGNKRKFRADPPMSEQTILSPAQAECSGYELFPTEKAPVDSNLEHPVGVCDCCRPLPVVPREQVDLDDYQDADWGDLTESELEGIVLSNLDAIYKSAIKKITACGYAEVVATNAVLSTGFCYGSKDTVSNIVDNALVYLRSGQQVDSSLRENLQDDLRKLEKTVLTEMVNVLKEVRPFFSTGDAMWCLLICDMNVSHACATEGPLGNDDNASCSSTEPQLGSETDSTDSNSVVMPELNVPGPSKLNSLLPCHQSSMQPELVPVVGLPSLPSNRFTSSIAPRRVSEYNLGKEMQSSFSDRIGEESSCTFVSHSSGSFVAPGDAHTTMSNLNPEKGHLANISDNILAKPSSASVCDRSMPEEKGASSKKGHLGNSKRDSILRQKSVHFEKSYRVFGTKATARAGKHAAFGGLVLDKNCKSLSKSSSITLKHSALKLNKAVGVDTPQADPTLSLSLSAGPSASSSYSATHLSNPLTSTELTLSLSSTSGSVISTKIASSVDAATYSSYANMPLDKMSGNWGPQDKKDEMVRKLIPRVRELQGQLQEWNDWAQQKVMQAARRLTKDKTELQSLRQEKEEVARLKKEKQALEESSVKKLSEMENALCKASGQVGRASAAMHRLEKENSELRQEMEAAKLRAAESAATCQEVSRREISMRTKFQSWERERTMLQEELVTEKRQISQIQQQLQQEKESQEQLEARWRQEEKLKDEALTWASLERKEREQIEISGKSKDDELKIKSVNDLERCKDDIRRLESQISQLRLITDSSKIAGLKLGMDTSYSSRILDGRKERNGHVIVKFADSGETESEDVQRERECVMCLTEEKSVVFLPCAHQVVCVTCNQLHEEQGMKDCPSCRTPIQRRICVRCANS